MQKEYQTENDFLANYKDDAFEKPTVTVNMVILRFDKLREKLQMLFVERQAYPEKGKWALPGNFLELNELTEEACLKETRKLTQTDITEDNIEQLYTFSTPYRDQRGWFISVAYLVFLPEDKQIVSIEEKTVAWFDVEITSVVPLEISLSNQQRSLFYDFKLTEDKNRIAFDHAEFISLAMKRIANKLYYDPIALKLLDTIFTIRQTCSLYEQLLGRKTKIDNSNQLRKLKHFIVEVGERVESRKGRPQKEYTVKKE